MRPPRMRTHRWMVAVATVALACATTDLIMERKKRFALIAREHTIAFPPISFANLDKRTERERELYARYLRIEDWHAEMVRKYRHAARYPWLPVAPDPPEPE